MRPVIETVLKSGDDLPTASAWMDAETTPTGLTRPKQSQNAGQLMNLHLGQRKLCMSEVLALNHFLSAADEKCVVVYAGAAAGQHIPFLSRLYPGATFELYDPAPFKMVGADPERLHVHNVFFTDEVAASWAGKCDVFICDIRLVNPGGGQNNMRAFEVQVGADMAAQDRWSRLIRPRLGCCLKFRPPFLDEEWSRIQGDTMEYIKGRVMWQCWPPAMSAEGRLIVEAQDSAAPPMTYDVRAHENKCYAHNAVTRPWARFADVVPGLKDLVPGFDGGFDCTLEALAWKDYCALPGALAASVAACMNALTKAIQQRLDGRHRTARPRKPKPYGGVWPKLHPAVAIDMAIRDSLQSTGVEPAAV